MSRIKILPDELVGIISAGEVVERPASAVKELVENAIDAKASEILVSIEEGGRKKISVTDDGIGMSPEDLKLCALRYATSKITSKDDLQKIRTMGFRGEALPSIAAVSRLTIETRQRGENLGHKLRVEGGKELELIEAGIPEGTRVVVSDLFFNTPARQKFLKSDRTEEGHIYDAISRIAIAYPGIRFKFHSDGKEKLLCLSVNDHHARICEVLGRKLCEGAAYFEESSGDISIRGFLGTPESSRMIVQGIYLFINGRFVKDRVVNHAVVEGYRSLIPMGGTPFAIIMLDISPERVDVNVHPTKQEVRFDNSGAIHSFVQMAVKKNVQSLNRGSAQPVVSYKNNFTSYLSPRKSFDFQQSTLSFLRPLAAPDKISFGNLRVIGQLSSSFILSEAQNGELIVVDQHAADERIGFENLKKQIATKGIERQGLLIPEQVDLGPKESAAVVENAELFQKAGIDIEPFGERTFIIKSVPAILGGSDVKGLIIKIVGDIISFGSVSSFEEKLEHLLKTIACHKQVRAGQSLKKEEMEALLKRMDEWPNTTTCPHGRPTYKLFGQDEVGRWFER